MISVSTSELFRVPEAKSSTTAERDEAHNRAKGKNKQTNATNIVVESCCVVTLFSDYNL